MRLAALLTLVMGCASPPGSLEGDAGRADVPRRDAPSSDTGSDAGDDASDAESVADAPVPVDAYRGPEADCVNTEDDDLDGDVDCYDADCEGLTCDDRDPCTGAEVCAAGLCVGSPGRAVHRCPGVDELDRYAFEGCPSDCGGGDSGPVWRVPPDPVGPVVRLHQWLTRGCAAAACAMTDACLDAIIDDDATSPAPTTYCADDYEFGSYPTTPAEGLLAITRVGNATCRHAVVVEGEAVPAGLAVEETVAYVCPP